MARPCRGSVGKELRVARLVQADEPERGRVDGLAHRDEAVVLQDDGLAVTQGFGNPLAFLSVQHDPPKVIVDRMTPPEADGVLGHHVQLAAKDREGLAVDGVSVAGRVHIGPSFMDFRMDGKCRGIDGLIPDHHVAVLID